MTGSRAFARRLLAVAERRPGTAFTLLLLMAGLAGALLALATRPAHAALPRPFSGVPTCAHVD